MTLTRTRHEPPRFHLSPKIGTSTLESSFAARRIGFQEWSICRPHCVKSPCSSFGNQADGVKEVGKKQPLHWHVSVDVRVVLWDSDLGIALVVNQRVRFVVKNWAGEGLSGIASEEESQELMTKNKPNQSNVRWGTCGRQVRAGSRFS